MAIPVIYAGLVAVALPIAIKILIALGIGFATFTGVDLAVDSATAYVQSNYDSMPTAMLAIMTMAGFADGIKIIFAAYSAMIAIKITTGSFTRLTMGNTGV